MKIVNAIWEKRNFGFDAYEVCLTKDDCGDIEKILSDLGEEQYKNAYMTLKLPIGNLVALHKLEDAGFRFMETQFRMKCDIAHYETPVKLSGIENEIHLQEVHKDLKSWQLVTDMITDGMFHTDRIYLDDIFEWGTSAKRYKNWIMDMLAVPNVNLNLYTLHDEFVGFDMQQLDMDKMLVEGVLGGIFENYLNEGLGIFMFDTLLRYVQSKGIKKLYTCVSSNNINIVRQNIFFGYEIIGETYVLRRK